MTGVRNDSEPKCAEKLPSNERRVPASKAREESPSDASVSALSEPAEAPLPLAKVNVSATTRRPAPCKFNCPSSSGEPAAANVAAPPRGVAIVAPASTRSVPWREGADNWMGAPATESNANKAPPPVTVKGAAVAPPPTAVSWLPLRMASEPSASATKRRAVI